METGTISSEELMDGIRKISQSIYQNEIIPSWSKNVNELDIDVEKYGSLNHENLDFGREDRRPHVNR